MIASGVVFGIYYVFHGIGKKAENPQQTEKHSVSDSLLPKSSSAKKKTISIRPDEEPVVYAPVARNSVKFKHRPVPSIEQLNLLTGSNGGQQSNNNEDNVVRRAVVAVPDAATNTVMLYGDLVEVERLAEALRSMDQVIQTCHLKTWVVFVRGDKSKGFDLVANIISSPNKVFNAGLGGGIFTATLGLDRLQASLNISQSRGLLEIVDQPYMQLLHAQKSIISTVEEIAIPTTTVSQGVSETSIEFKQVGLTIEVTPWFLDKERVRLNVAQRNGVVGATRTIAGAEIPELSTQSLKTAVELRMGQVIVLGGVESAERERRKGWLTKKEVRKVGHVYIVAAIYSTIPKAIPVLDTDKDMPLHPFRPVPAIPFMDNGSDLLPTWRKK